MSIESMNLPSSLPSAEYTNVKKLISFKASLIVTYAFIVAASFGAQDAFAQTQQSCSVTTSSNSNLGRAIALFASQCPTFKRRDCDPGPNGVWQCSSERINGVVSVSTSVNQPVNQQPVAPPMPTPTSGTSQVCFAIANTFGAAARAYAQSCPNIPRADCDPIVGGRWQCSSGVIGGTAPEGTVVAQQTAPAPAPVTTPSSPLACTATGSTIGAAISSFARSCPSIPRADCDPIGGGNWMCSSARIGGSGIGQTAPVAPTAPPAPVAPSMQPTPSTPSLGRLNNGDLLALHYDNCPDRDDGHAMAAGYTITQRLNIVPFVVNGTCGNLIRDKYQSGSASVVAATFNNALNAQLNRVQSVSRAATAWASVLSNGKDVWVAEGGPSDFTAEVLRELKSRYPGLNRKRVHVVQHSNWNEEMTTNAGLAFVRSVADYTRIQSGNSLNRTANLNQKSNFFVSRARQSRFASAWNAAFDYLDPNRRLDFSDTVILLHILNEISIRSVDDFARRYF